MQRKRLLAMRRTLLPLRSTRCPHRVQYTFRLAPRQATPLPLKMGITLSPRGGLWVVPTRRTGGGGGTS